MFRGVIVLPVLAVAVGVESVAQSPGGTAVRATFEVASVKPNVSNSGSSSSNEPPGGYVARNLSLRRLIAIAYRMRLANDRERIVGPSWIDNARFDIDARTAAGTRSEQIPDMLRTLLADRFGLAVHAETREDLVYALVRTRGEGPLGPQLTPSTLDCSKPGAFRSGSAGAGAPSAAIEKPQCGILTTVDANGSVLQGGGRSIADLASNLIGRVNREVVDRTGLSGSYDFTLRWTPENFQNPADNAGPSRDGTTIFTALQEQLGLKLEAQRGPVEFLIIDKVERPLPD
jgi:uncharacterized protein (TIGR03435 family)